VGKIFALAGAVKAGRDRQFGIFDRQFAILVVNDHADFGIAHRTARLRAGKNDVLHAGAAQCAHALFAEHPADGVGYVRLAAAVRTDDGGDALVELDDGTLRKGLEALDFERFQVHETTPVVQIQNSIA